MTTHRLSEDDLNPKEELFIAEYLIECNASKAIVSAGYQGTAPHLAGYKMLNRPHVRKEIEARREEMMTNLGITYERVARECARLAFSDVRRLFKDDGTLKPLSELSEDDASAISSLEVDELFEGSGKDRVQVGVTRKVKLWNKADALKDLMDLLGMRKSAKQFDAPVGPGMTIIIQQAQGVTAGPQAQQVVFQVPVPDGG